MMLPQLDPQEADEMLFIGYLLVDDSQPMEAPRVVYVRVIDATISNDPPSGRFSWTIENFKGVTSQYPEGWSSPVFNIAGNHWQLLFLPNWNNTDHLSLGVKFYNSKMLPPAWSRFATFSWTVIDQIRNEHSIRRVTQHQFHEDVEALGFSDFMLLSELYDPHRGYLVNDTCIVEFCFAACWIDYCSLISQKETGYVGLKNQGATCYMNSLLQILYHISFLRKAVYDVPTTENDMLSGSIPSALQSLFYELQFCDTSVATKDLTKSFGWDAHDSFMQHDVQEFNRVLCEKLEDKMKGTIVEGSIRQLFEGHWINTVECINVDYKSTSEQSFYDLQLDVKGCQDVYASFDKYVDVEQLEGNNKYDTEQYGLQDARKHILFVHFPPVLQLQLKRFEYDSMLGRMVKVNDRFEFSLQLDLDRDNGKYLSPGVDRSVRNLYTLYSVVVHSGGVNSGHYYAYIRPNLLNQWFKFDDERVEKVDMRRALEEQYGGDEELPHTNVDFNNLPFKIPRCHNAYILVYIRECDIDKIMCNVDKEDIAENLRVRLKKEHEEKEQKRKKEAKAHLYTILKVARNEDLFEQIGKDIFFHLVDHDKELVAIEFGIPVQCQRFWFWSKYRPFIPLTPEEEQKPVGRLRLPTNDADLNLFLEVQMGPDLLPVPLPEKSSDLILLFFKVYDPSKEELRYVGKLLVNKDRRLKDILRILNKKAGFDPYEEIKLYEESRVMTYYAQCTDVIKRKTLAENQLDDGDIICFQKKYPQDAIGEQYRYPDVRSFFLYLYNIQVVRFRSLENPRKDKFCLKLSKLHSYNDVVEKVAQHLGLNDPSKLRLTSHNCYSLQPKSQAIKYQGVKCLDDMLVDGNQSSDILYYDVLDIPLPEFEGLKTLKICFHHSTKDEVVLHTIRLPKESTVKDVINDIKLKVDLCRPDAELRLVEVFHHKIYKIFPLNEQIEYISERDCILRAEEIPEEQKNLGPHDRLIHAFHFMKAPAQSKIHVQHFGDPFFLVIHEDEILSDVKLRIQKKLSIPDEEFFKWKFAFISNDRREYLLDSDVVSSRFQVRDLCAWEQCLGLEHTDNASKMSYVVKKDLGAYRDHNPHKFDQPLKIYN